MTERSENHVLQQHHNLEVPVEEVYELEKLLRRPSLRRSLRPDKKDIYPPDIELTDETRCGIGCIRGKWLQSFANKKSYVFLYGLLGSIYGAWYAYFNGTITTLEKRFKIPSRTMGVVAAGSDIIQIFVPPFLSYYTDKRHRPRWIAIGVYSVVLSCIVMTLPHFIYGPGEDSLTYTYEYGDTSAINQSRIDFLEIQKKKTLCDIERSNECKIEEQDGWTPVILLLASQLINGMGGSLYYTVGTTYMDDNIKKSKTPALASFSFFIKMVGPAFGYWLSSVSLKVFVSPQLTPTIDETDPRWIGAWWIGWLILGTLLFVNASLVGLFPKTLPRAAARRAAGIDKRKNRTPTSLKDLLNTMKRLIKNPILTCNNLAAVFYIFGFMAHWIFMPKYIELQYRKTASTSNMVTGTTTLIFAACGILISGVLISKYQFRARYLAGWNVIVGLCSTLGMILYVYLGCQELDQIKTVNTTYNTTQACNLNCSCDYIMYSPVCSELHETFISPCHAGCTDSIILNDTKVYTNCSCVPLTKDGADIFGVAYEGQCPIDCQSTFFMFVGVVCLLHFIGASGRTSNFLVQMRCVDEDDKCVSLGYGLTILCLFAFVPSPIIFGYIIDTTCLVWGKTCTGTGNCWVYDVGRVRYLMNYTAAFFVFIGTLFDMGVWYHVKDLKIFDEEEDKTREIT